LDSSIEKRRLYAQDALNDKFYYLARLDKDKNIDSNIFLTTEVDLFRKTFASKLLQLSIYYNDDSSSEKPTSSEFVVKLNPGEIAKPSVGSNFLHDAPLQVNTFLGQEYKFHGSGYDHSRSASKRSSININLEYSSAADERIEYALLTGLAALFSVGIGLMIQALCDEWSRRRV
jgi:hypothetical protein